MAATNRDDHRYVARWMQVVYAPDADFESLNKPGPGMNLADKKLQLALCKTLPQDLERKIGVKKRQLSDVQQIMSGRQVLWMIVDYFRTNKGLGHVYTLQDITAVQWFGDRYNDMLAFRDKWEDTIHGLHPDITENMLAEILVDQMAHSKELLQGVRSWRKLDRDDPKRSHASLLAIMDDHIAFTTELHNRNRWDSHREASMQYAMSAFPKGGGGKGKGDGKGKGKGKGDGKGKGKGGKGKGKSQSPHRTSEVKKLCPQIQQLGTCTFGDQCKFSHDLAGAMPAAKGGSGSAADSKKK